MELGELKNKIRSVEDWPKQGIVFRDFSPVLEDRNTFHFLIERLALEVKDKEIDKIVGIDARGFILASALAYKLKVGLAIARKKGKLPPGNKLKKQYSLEYAADALEMGQGSIKQGEKVLLVDDVLATGGTMASVVEMVKESGGEIADVLFFIELTGLKGRNKLERLIGCPIKSLIKF